MGSLREGRAEGPRAARIDTPKEGRPGDGADRGGASRPKFLGCLLGQTKQDWKCLLSKQGRETPHPGGLTGAGGGGSGESPPTPGSSPCTWQTGAAAAATEAAVCPSLQPKAPGHVMQRVWHCPTPTPGASKAYPKLRNYPWGERR